MAIKYCMKITGEYYDDYNEAREAALEYLDYDSYHEALEVIITEHGINSLIDGLIHPNIGAQLYEEILNTAEQIVLNNFLIENEVEENEENESI